MKANVLVLDYSGDPLGLSVVRCLGQCAELKLHVLTGFKAAPSRYSRYVSWYEAIAEGADEERWVEAIHRAIDTQGIDIVFPVGYAEMLLLSRYGGDFDGRVAIHPVAEVEQLDIASDKWKLMEFLRKNSLSYPKAVLIDGACDFSSALDGLRFPVLVKQTDLSAGRGIRRFSRASEVISFFRERSGRSRQYMVQEYVAGYDLDFSCLCKDGKILAYTIQKGIKESAMAYKPPLTIEFVDDRRVYDLMASVMGRLHWNGIANADLRCDEERGEIKLIEINARYWMSLLGSLAVGVNFPYLGYLMAVGREFPVPTYKLGVYRTHKESVLEVLRNPLSLGRFHSLLKYTLLDPIPVLAMKFTRRTYGDAR